MNSRILVLLLCIIALATILPAKEMAPYSYPNKIEIEPQTKVYSSSRIVPEYTFTRTPISIMTSYYDYMIGSYHSLPLQIIPDNAEGGYFMTYHGRRMASGTRRVFYSYISPQGEIIANNEISDQNLNEGYPTLAVDPVSGKPLYAWHGNFDADLEYEIKFASDAFLDGITGLFHYQIIFDNPIIIDPPDGPITYDNDFDWPTAVIGPSPIAGKRRIYVVATNSVTHSSYPVENPYIAYADFNEEDIEEGNDLVWSYTSIPELNQWNVDMNWRRPFHSITCDNSGNLYYAGYHTAYANDGITPINEPDLDVFICPNYGQGTWRRVSSSSHLNMWNPPTSPTDNTGYFVSPVTGQPYGDNGDIYFGINNSGHLNASVDNEGRVHVFAIWAFKNSDDYYYPNYQYVKEFIFNPQTETFTIKDICPQKDPADTFNTTFCPWDLEPPFGEVDEFSNIAPSNPLIVSDWPYPHWDDTAHSDAMQFHYNNCKITNANEEGMMAAVWQNSERARRFNKFGDMQYLAYANTPEIWIAVSPDNGNTWSEPIILNNVDTPQFAGLKPMWVYPANKIKYIGMQEGHKVGKLALMFYNDYTWGSNVITPPYHMNPDGGQVMFTELQIVFPVQLPTEDPFGEPIVLSSSMTVMAGVQINGVMASEGDVVAAYVNVNGVPQLRGKETVQVIDGVAGCLLQVYTETNGEIVYFKVWDASTNRVYFAEETLNSIVNGTIGEYPQNLFWLNFGTSQLQIINLQTGWNMISLNVHPESMDITDIFNDIMSNIVMIKSPNGVFIPDNPYNTLTNLADGKGYFVKVSSPCNLLVNGIAIDVAQPINLNPGWNLIGYTPQVTLNTGAALANIATHLIQIKGEEGVYETNNPFSNLNVLHPGKAYWIKVNASCNLVYPLSGKQNIIFQPVLSCKKYGTPIVKTNSQTVLCSLNELAQEGDILATLVNEELRGLSYIKKNNGITGALINIFTEEAGEIIQFKLIKKDSDEVYNFLPDLLSAPGEAIGNYEQGIFYNLIPDQNQIPEINTALISAYPNPFTNSTSISLIMGKEKSPIQLNIYNLRGQKVKTLFDGTLDSGNHNLIWDATDDNGRKVASGIYYCKLHSAGKNQLLKLLLLK